MKKEDLTVPAILAEAVGILLCILYIGLQIFYGINYHVAPYKYICNIVGLVLVYAGLTILSNHPERINRIPAQMCVGKIRIYSLRMLRLKIDFCSGADDSVCRRCDWQTDAGCIQPYYHRTAFARDDLL